MTAMAQQFPLKLQEKTLPHCDRNKYVLVLSGHTKAGSEVIRNVFATSDTTDVVTLAPSLRQLEGWRSQLPADVRQRLHPHECDFNSIGAIRTTVLRLLGQYKKFESVTYVLPELPQRHLEIANVDDLMDTKLQRHLEVHENAIKAFDCILKDCARKSGCLFVVNSQHMSGRG